MTQEFKFLYNGIKDKLNTLPKDKVLDFKNKLLSGSSCSLAGKNTTVTALYPRADGVCRAYPQKRHSRIPRHAQSGGDRRYLREYQSQRAHHRSYYSCLGVGKQRYGTNGFEIRNASKADLAAIRAAVEKSGVQVTVLPGKADTQRRAER